MQAGGRHLSVLVEIITLPKKLFTRIALYNRLETTLATRDQNIGGILNETSLIYRKCKVVGKTFGER